MFKNNATGLFFPGCQADKSRANTSQNPTKNGVCNYIGYLVIAKQILYIINCHKFKILLSPTSH